MNNGFQMAYILNFMNSVALTDIANTDDTGATIQISWNPTYSPTEDDIRRLELHAQQVGLKFVRNHITEWDDAPYPAVLMSL